MTNEARFDYAHYRTLAKAEAALEDMFATGEVWPSERPKIEKRTYAHGVRYAVTLPA